MTDNERGSAFQEASSERRQGLVSEFWFFMKENSKWWLIPFLVVFGLIGVVLVLGSTGAAPFIYTMF
jgi:hypothetical protein